MELAVSVSASEPIQDQANLFAQAAADEDADLAETAKLSMHETYEFWSQGGPTGNGSDAWFTNCQKLREFLSTFEHLDIW